MTVGDSGYTLTTTGKPNEKYNLRRNPPPTQEKKSEAGRVSLRPQAKTRGRVLNGRWIP